MPNGEVVLAPVSALRADDRVLVRPGERVPADGVVLTGASQIDESFVTGETLRRPIAAGATVYAGTMNYGGALEVRVTAAGEGTLIDEIERLLDKAVMAKSRYVRLADRAASYYAPVVHTAALLTLTGWLVADASFHFSIVTAISVLIITCPCALALAVPVVQVVAAGALFRAGIFLNAGDAIERMAEADMVVFDKTGTLTLPEPHIANAEAIDPALLSLAARLAKSSSHPLAAVVARGTSEAPIPDAAEETGQGVRALVDGAEARLGSLAFCSVPEPQAADGDDVTSRIAVAHQGRHAILVVRQMLRTDAVAVADELRKLGLGMMILSGDRASAVAPIAQALGIEEWRGEVKPADKVAVLQALKEKGRRVLMVGDGLNDSPALASAHVSLAPISAADLSKAHADAVFLGEKLVPVRDAVVVARRARALMRENLWLAVIYNIIAVPVAIAGWVTPLIAAAAMSGSSILVTLNAFRLHAVLRRKVETLEAEAPSAVGGPAWTS
jgi:Cu2+-exporting ATPase